MNKRPISFSSSHTRTFAPAIPSVAFAVEHVSFSPPGALERVSLTDHSMQHRLIFTAVKTSVSVAYVALDKSWPLGTFPSIDTALAFLADRGHDFFALFNLLLLQDFDNE